MHRATCTRWLRIALRTWEQHAQSEIQMPIFLCPALSRRQLNHEVSSAARGTNLRPPRGTQKRRIHVPADTVTTTTPSSIPVIPEGRPARKLPAQCTGCGALSQTSFPEHPGYFDLGRKAVRLFAGLEQPRSRRSRREDDLYQDALSRVDPAKLEKLGIHMDDVEPSLSRTSELESERLNVPPKVPLCDRCHQLLHHQSGISIYHPTMESIRDTIDESPYKYNHVYHVLDAADFPMSILPQIHQLLDLMPLRTKNRRAAKGKFFHGQKTELSFIITRSDLLAPQKAQVDSLMPYLREVLRDALGRAGREYRLGNIKCVSAKKSWWTKELKDDIWRRGGAGWLVGRVNVGKSQLFKAVFPKGRMDWTPSPHQITVDMYGNNENNASFTETAAESQGTEDELIAKPGEDVDELSLLPPARPESQYPEMPVVSDLPGTTASPIRVPFGNGRGELIDLPGVERTGLEKYVKEEHRLSLVMRNRIVPEQLAIKEGQSILLGGFIRITPRVPGPIVLSYAFTPLQAHLTGTEKAISIQEQKGEINVENVAVAGTGEKTKLAGSFELKWDVTKERAGPITRKGAIGIKVERLPYRVLATDILIEGVGWVEVAAQVRTRQLFAPKPESEMVTQEPTPDPEKGLSALERLEALAEDPKKKKTQQPSSRPEKAGDEPNWPIVDVYSPEGKFIGCRRPMNGWLLNKSKVTKESLRSRPRRSMKGMKKLEKMRKRQRSNSNGKNEP